MVESLIERLTRRRYEAFLETMDVHYMTNVVGESIFSEV